MQYEGKHFGAKNSSPLLWSISFWVDCTIISLGGYSNGSQPFETHGPLGKFCLGLQTTLENCSTSALWWMYYYYVTL